MPPSESFRVLNPSSGRPTRHRGSIARPIPKHVRNRTRPDGRRRRRRSRPGGTTPSGPNPALRGERDGSEPAPRAVLAHRRYSHVAAGRAGRPDIREPGRLDPTAALRSLRPGPAQSE